MIYHINNTFPNIIFLSVTVSLTHANQISEQIFLCYVVFEKVKAHNITSVIGKGTW